MGWFDNMAGAFSGRQSSTPYSAGRSSATPYGMSRSSAAGGGGFATPYSPGRQSATPYSTNRQSPTPYPYSGGGGGGGGFLGRIGGAFGFGGSGYGGVPPSPATGTGPNVPGRVPATVPIGDLPYPQDEGTAPGYGTRVPMVPTGGLPYPPQQRQNADDVSFHLPPDGYPPEEAPVNGGGRMITPGDPDWQQLDDKRPTLGGTQGGGLTEMESPDGTRRRLPAHQVPFFRGRGAREV